MKRAFPEKTEFRKYLLYGLGELLLVIIGILIALQVYDWRSEKKQQQTLENYLNGIALNIRSDLDAVAAVRGKRDEAYELSLRHFFFVSDESSFDAAGIVLADRALTQAKAIHFFSSNNSGFSALKTSGSLALLQGGDIEKLLFDYYDTVNRIVYAEQNHNEYVRLLSLDMMDDWPAGIEESEFSLADALAKDRFQALQPLYQQIIGSPKTNALLAHARAVGPLLLEYERLERLGNAFVTLVEDQAMEFDDATTAEVYHVYDPNSGIGNPEVIADGKITWHSYDLGIADSTSSQVGGHAPDAANTGGQQPIDLKSVEEPDRSLYVNYGGGAEWAVVFFTVRGSSETRASKDFSSFARLRLELKGDRGGERVLVHMKDSSDPDDGSQSNIEVRITDQWQIYEIDLAEFRNADLRHLHVVPGFLFDTEPQAFSIRNVEFIKAD